MLLGPPSAVQEKLTSELLVLRISDGVIITLTGATEKKRERVMKQLNYKYCIIISYNSRM